MCNPPAIVSPGEPQVKLDQFFEKMLSAFAKIVKPSVPKFSGGPLEYSKIKAAFKVEVDKKEVYDATEKLKSLLGADEERAKSGSDKYDKTWALVAWTLLCPQLKGV